MPTAKPQDAARVVAQFERLRRTAGRVSIDAALDTLPLLEDRAATRTTALQALAQKLRQTLRDGTMESDIPATSAECLSVGELPDLEGYEIIDVLGRGGMGVVYEAYQRSTGRRVALKFMLAAGAATEALRRRFEREVELVARLQHPHIVTLLDSGVHQGRYFYVMEYIAGRALDQWILNLGFWNLDLKPRDREVVPQSKIQLPKSKIEEILRLLAAIADAVDYAHQRGVLHRDLKPSNILIDERGEPHVLDFGLAKAMDPQSGRWLDATLSEPGQILGTLGYMSPEQSRGQFDQLSVRSDVYSLGAIGYELVAGRLPCDVSGPLAEVLRRISEQDPPPPSVVRKEVGRWERGNVGTESGEGGRPTGWRRYVPTFPRSHMLTDVDAILLKALDKSPERRYATAAEFAADIRRYLSREPVLAHPPSALYQLRKLVARHKLPSALAAGLFLALLIFSVTMSVLYRRTLAAEVDARQQAREAGIAQRIAQAERNTATQARDEAQTEMRKAAEIARFLQEMLALADPDTAQGRDVSVLLEMLNGAAQRVEQEFSDQPEVEAALRETLGRTYLSIAAYGEACRHLQAALDLRRQCLGEEARATVETAHGLARVAIEEGHLEEAEERLRSLVEISRRVCGPEDSCTLNLLVSFGSALHQNGKLPEAESCLKEAWAGQRRVLGEEHGDTLTTMHNLARLWHHQGKLGAAETLLRNVAEITQRLAGDNHPRTLMARNNLALTLADAGRTDEAEKLLREVLDGRRRVLGEEHAHTITTLDSLGCLLCQRRQVVEAETLLRRALEIRRRTQGADHPDTLRVANALAETLALAEKPAEAEAFARQALEGQRRVLGHDHFWTLKTLANLGAILEAEGNFAEAETHLRAALEGQRRALGGENPVTLLALNSLAHVVQVQGKLTEAEALFRQALEMSARVLGEAHPDTLAVLNNLAATLAAQGRIDEAEPLLRRVVETAQRTLPAQDVRVAQFQLGLGALLFYSKRLEEAEPYLLAGYTGLKDALGETHAVTRAAGARLAEFYIAWNKPAEAARYQMRPANPPE